MSLSTKFSPFNKKTPKHGFRGKSVVSAPSSIAWNGSSTCQLYPGISPSPITAYTSSSSDTLTVGVALYIDAALTQGYSDNAGEYFIYENIWYRILGDNTIAEVGGECYKPQSYTANGCGSSIENTTVVYIQQVGSITTPGYTVYVDPFASTVFTDNTIYVDTNSDNYSDTVVTLTTGVITNVTSCGT